MRSSQHSSNGDGDYGIDGYSVGVNGCACDDRDYDDDDNSNCDDDDDDDGDFVNHQQNLHRKFRFCD